MIRLGCLDYINVLPVMHHLGDAPGIERVGGEPQRLNALLSEGALDVSLISSIEYARHQDSYAILPDLSISSRGAVRSVTIFSWQPLERLEKIGVCSATATSVVLMQVLLADTPIELQPHATVADLERENVPALLLIGDAALDLHERRVRGLHAYDLGEMWQRATGLPMVFALWAARVPATRAADVAEVGRRLVASRLRGVELPPDLLSEAARRTGLTVASLRKYYGGLEYSLDANHLQGLLRFYDGASKLGLCPPCPQVRFVQSERSVTSC